MGRVVKLDARGACLRAALAAVLVPDNAPELQVVRAWLDSWSGIGLIVAGMTHQGFTVSLGERGQPRGVASMAQRVLLPSAWNSHKRAVRSG